jgi:EpsI family protein
LVLGMVDLLGLTDSVDNASSVAAMVGSPNCARRLCLMQSDIRFALAVMLLGSAGLFLRARGGHEITPARLPLSAFPYRLDVWEGTDQPLEKDALAVLGPGEFMLRTYSRSGSSEPALDLFIAYFPSQRFGDTIHSPRNCLPGSGWAPQSHQTVTLSVPGSAVFQVNQYVIAKGDARELVLYWYLAHNRVIASEYWAKAYLVLDALRLNRGDGAFIRLATPMRANESVDLGMERLYPLTSQLVPRLKDYIPQ